MRRGLSLQFVGVLTAAAALAGCRNQTGGITNPFITADKVPPPQTRVLAPGTAQPYYQGDPIPGAAPAGTPMIGTPAATPGYATPGYTPTATTPTYAPAGAAGASPALTTPPGGWGSPYPPQSSVTPTGPTPEETVSVPGDPQGLRFAGGSAAQPASAATDAAPSVASFSTPAPNVAGARLPIQSMLPLGGAGAALSTPEPSRLAQREVTAAEYFAPPSIGSSVQPASATLGGDGFRPQGSSPRSCSCTDSTIDAFRPPSMRGSSGANGGATTEDATRFAAGENYESLRGQLEYWPVRGEWSLRYQSEGVPADALGGRVMIDNPQVLANLQPGEMVTVRGQAYSRPTESGAVQPAYRVSAVQRQRL
jgi:hypothetical protein